MRVESAVTSISWIPSEAVAGLTKLPFEGGVAHYDDPPPDAVEGERELVALRDADRFRFANHLRAWIDVDDDGRITGHGQSGRGLIGSTTVRLGRRLTFAAVSLPDLVSAPRLGEGWVRFSQTAGGRTGLPMPRTVSHPPYVQLRAPIAYTTVTLTLHADGRVEHALSGASAFPRHWVYGGDGRLSHKSGLIDFADWAHHCFGRHTPWGEEESPALVAQVETALERELSLTVMRGGRKPKIRRIRPGAELVQQGAPGGDLFLLLDGILTAEVDGRALADCGPGALLGERAVLEGGARTATLRARTPCTVAVASPDALDRDRLVQLSCGHRREADVPG